jgi:hypothetical protein
MFAPCFDRGHLLRNTQWSVTGAGGGLDWWGFTSERGRGGVDGTRNGQQAAATMLPKSALSKVFWTRKPGTGLVPPLSTFAPRCADLIWGHCPFPRPWERGTGGGGRTSTPCSGRVPSHSTCAQPVPSLRCQTHGYRQGGSSCNIVWLGGHFEARSRFAHRDETGRSIQRCRLRLRLPVPR